MNREGDAKNSEQSKAGVSQDSENRHPMLMCLRNSRSICADDQFPVSARKKR